MHYDKEVVLVVNTCVMYLPYNRGVDRSEKTLEHKVW